VKNKAKDSNKLSVRARFSVNITGRVGSLSKNTTHPATLAECATLKAGIYYSTK